MRKLVYSTSLSLDGYIDSAAGDPSWVAPDEELHRHFNDVEREVDTLLYGRRMYEIMAGYWPTADQDPSAPGVIVLSMAGGAFFGLVWGTLLASFGFARGGVVAFLLARRFLRARVRLSLIHISEPTRPY